MKKYVKSVLLAGSIVFSISLVGCVDKKEDLTPISIVEKMEDLVFSDKEPLMDVTKYMDLNISNIKDLDLSSSMINTYIYSLYSNLEKYLSITETLKEDLIFIEKDLSGEEISVDSIKNIPENYKVVRGFLEELKDNYYALFKKDGVYIVDVDMESIKNDFKNYMNMDTENYIDFRINENKLDIYDLNADKYNLNNVVNLFNETVKSLKTLEGQSQKENWVQSMYYYMNIITSRTQSTFIKSDGKVDENILVELKKLTNNLDLETESKKFMSEYIKLLEDNNLDLKSESISEYINKVYKSIESFSVDKK